MTSREKDLITKVADEIRTADRAAVDREAERFIRAEVAAQPNAAYILTQRVIVQELALKQAREKIEELEGRLKQAGLATGNPGNLPVATPVAGSPPSRSGVGDFLRTAAAAAAGTIGGQLIYDGLRGWASGHSPGHGGGGFFDDGPIGGGFIPSGRGRGREDDLGVADDRGPDAGPAGDDVGGGDFGDDPGAAAEEDASDAGDDTGGGDWGDASDVGGGDLGGSDGGDDSGGGSW